MVARVNQEFKFRPTKTWLREHRYKPRECQSPDCVCIIDNFNKNHQGTCVGYYGQNGDLDMVSLCWVAWDKEKQQLVVQNALLHPQEANTMAMFLSWAAGAMWGIIPGYRAQISSMLRKRTRDIRNAEKQEADESQR